MTLNREGVPEEQRKGGLQTLVLQTQSEIYLQHEDFKTTKYEI